MVQDGEQFPSVLARMCYDMNDSNQNMPIPFSKGRGRRCYSWMLVNVYRTLTTIMVYLI